MQFFNTMRFTSIRQNTLVFKVAFTLIISYILLNFVSCSGCPYSFTGASVPPHLKTIAIPYADDRSGAGEPSLRDLLTQMLTQKFINDNNLKITDRSSADAVLECIITGFNDAPAIVSSGENVTTRRITITVQVSYKDLVKRKTIYEKQFSNYGDYDPSKGFDDRNNAISTAIDKISDDILLDTVSGW
jgi:hypothetical protein